VVVLALCVGAFTTLAQSRKKRTQRRDVSQSDSKRNSGRRDADAKSKPAQRSLDHEPEIEDIEGRENWFYRQRAYPFDSIPDDARQQAWANRPKRKGDQIEAQSWQPIGPVSTSSSFVNQWGTTSGRISAIAIKPDNPQIILVGGPTGGLWRSADGGANFVAVADNLTDVSIGSIAFAPSNPSIVYAGSGDGSNRAYFGVGVLKSTDAGLTWVRISDNSLTTFGVVRQVAVDPGNPATVYAVQYNRRNTTTNGNFASGFFRSTDGGVTWTRTLSGLFRNMAIQPGTPQTLFLAATRVDPADPLTPPGIYRSLNGGQNWNLVYTAPFQTTSDLRVAVTPANPQMVYVYEGGTNGGPRQLRVEVSADAGGTWSNNAVHTDIDPGQFNYNTYISVSPTDANTIYVGSRDIFKSTNGGTNFTNIVGNFAAPTFQNYTPAAATTHSDQQVLVFAPNDSNTILVGNDGGLFKSTNGGTTLTSLNNTLSLTQFVGYAIDPADPTRSYGGTQDNGSQRRQANSTQWREVDSGDGGNFVVDQLTPGTVFSTYIYGSITRFTNFGATFDTAVGTNATFGEPPDDQSPRINFYPPFTGNGVDSKLYFGTFRLFISTNRGDTWTAPGGMTDVTQGGGDVLTAIGVAKSNINTIYVGSTFGTVQVSTNGGVAWTDVTAGLPTRSISGITVSATDPATAYVIVSGFGTGHVFKTTNTGGVWTDISGNLPNIPTDCLLVDPQNANTIYVGTDIGVFQSTTGGNTWATFNTGLPPVVVTKLVASTNGTIQAGTYGRGAYELVTTGNPTTTVQFSSATYNVSETGPRVDITLTRSGNTTSAASVNYATNDAAGLQNCNVFNGIASPRCDYSNTIGTATWAAGDATSKTFSIAIVDDAYAEGNETFTIGLNGPSGATLGTQSTATATITDNDVANGTNPIDNTNFFVRQQYIDFLGREPDPPGFAGWTATINNCAAGDTNCDRIHVSQLFFQSAEFQDRGYFVYRFYPVAFGRKPDYAEFVPDLASVSGFLDATQLEAAKVAFINAFMARTAFVNTYNGLSNQQYVDALLNTAAVTLANRQAMIDGLNNATMTRAVVLRTIVESTAVAARYRNQAYAVMEYFGYLRRQPDGFYLQWIQVLDTSNDPRGMVTGFVTSQEYRNRFGP